MKVYGMRACGDCVAMLAEFEEKHLPCEFVEITDSTACIKEFLALRDTDPVFEEVRREHRIGIPCFVLPDGRLTLSLQEAEQALETR